MSVLETPRLIFRGQMTWDPITTNNYPQEYDEAEARTSFSPPGETVATFRQKAIDQVLTGNWNPGGTHRSTYNNTTVVGTDIGEGLSTDDPIVTCPVSFTGMLVDLEPYGSTSSQLFFDEMSFGIEGGCRVFAPSATRMIARYVNFARNQTYRVIAGVASVVWQTSFPKGSGLRIDAHDSFALQRLAESLQDEDVLGLTVRWNAYRTIYYDDPANSKTLWKQLHDKLIGGGFQPNPARSQLVGVLGLWRKGEPPAEPGDRALLTQTDNSSPIVGSAHVRLTANRLTLDLANSIQETGVDLTKANLGELTAVAVAPDGKTVLATLGTFGYDAYRKEAYEASAGIVTLDVDPAAAQKAQTADIQLRLQDGTVLMTEAALRAVPMTPNIYLDVGDTTTVSVQVLDRGQPAAAGVEVSLVKPNAAADVSTTSTTDPHGIATFPLTGLTGIVEQYVLLAGEGTPTVPPALDPQKVTYVNVRTLPADTDLALTPPTWDNVQAKVLSNWWAMAPCMDNWLDLGNSDQVKSFGPLLHKLTAKDNFESFRFMPVTRDMTAGQRTLLYNFLDGVAVAAADVVRPDPRKTMERLSRAMRQA
jgi:hypothetical protein